MHCTVQVHDALGGVVRKHIARLNTYHLFELHPARTILQGQHGDLAQHPLLLVCLRDGPAEQLRRKVTVQVDATCQLVHHVILPRRCHRHAQLNVGRIPHEDAVPLGRHDTLADTGRRPTSRHVLPVHLVAPGQAACCLRTPEVEVHRQWATLCHLHQTEHTGLGNRRLHTQPRRHCGYHLVVVHLQQRLKLFVRLGERIRYLACLGRYLGGRLHPHRTQVLRELVVGHDDVLLQLRPLQQLTLALHLRHILLLQQLHVAMELRLGEHPHDHVDLLQLHRGHQRLQGPAQVAANLRVTHAVSGVRGQELRGHVRLR